MFLVTGIVTDIGDASLSVTLTVYEGPVLPC